ncbi:MULTISPECIES: HAL/PAL/TAL family ammonia-lyase [Rhizobium]|uniref:HAL/PAL/TAL family ammonia-lyase n=1 Tax=Rhizobium TaxID=379 RepID=UPI001C8386AD|nr:MULTISPECIES: aromatic amino acid ammonia-lyase [Rhizobium]MBX4899674.1 aromatic amino acid lyase [Rhizobium bangladeshense]MBX5297529.1 aromatic amino acid lyase [Rhizobium sp. NLR15a]MBY3617867.1 aromatic amino acid lyase [Rhizobium bangladeshense]
MVTIGGTHLTIADIAAVAGGAKVQLSGDEKVRERVHRSRRIVQDALSNGQQIYGVTTLFGGMAGHRVSGELLSTLQSVALWQHKSTTGPRLPAKDVRATMLLRANSLMKGVSGIRLDVIERYAIFLNADACPHVYQRGSIGASGDLVPLSYIAGAIVGLNPAFKVDLNGEILDSHSALKQLGLRPIILEPKEGLALNNGTAACTAVAALCTRRAFDLAALTLAVHALLAQALLATSQSFHPFIHQQKPHPGQVWTAQEMTRLLEGSRFIRVEVAGVRTNRDGQLIQDRYSLRCLPQYFGPIIDALIRVSEQIEVEANSANDNPLIDPDTGEIYHNGNFLAQYTGIAMDQLRHHVGLMAKHLDVQIALLMSPEFNHGLAPSLAGNVHLGVNVGFKSLQIVGNALMPLISFHGQAIVDRYPTHAEQFNQNVNSQAMNAANLARESLDLMEHYLANALVLAVQAVELRAHASDGSYDATAFLSPATRNLYIAARTAALAPPSADRPLLHDDLDHFIQPMVEGVLAGMDGGGAIHQSLATVYASAAAQASFSAKLMKMHCRRS